MSMQPKTKQLLIVAAATTAMAITAMITGYFNEFVAAIKAIMPGGA